MTMTKDGRTKARPTSVVGRPGRGTCSPPARRDRQNRWCPGAACSPPFARENMRAYSWLPLGMGGAARRREGGGGRNGPEFTDVESVEGKWHQQDELLPGRNPRSEAALGRQAS